MLKKLITRLTRLAHRKVFSRVSTRRILRAGTATPSLELLEGRVLLTEYRWTNASRDGLWSTLNNWVRLDQGPVLGPGPNDTVFLAGSHDPYALTSIMYSSLTASPKVIKRLVIHNWPGTLWFLMSLSVKELHMDSGTINSALFAGYPQPAAVPLLYSLFLDGPGAYDWKGGTINIDLRVRQGHLKIDGNVTLGGVSGRLHIGTLFPPAPGLVPGTVSWLSGNVKLRDGGAIYNNNVFWARGVGGSIEGDGIIHNAPLISARFINSSGHNHIQVPFKNDPGGFIDVVAGTLEFQGGGTLLGTISINSFAVLHIGSKAATQLSTYILGGTRLVGDGAIESKGVVEVAAKMDIAGEADVGAFTVGGVPSLQPFPLTFKFLFGDINGVGHLRIHRWSELVWLAGSMSTREGTTTIESGAVARVGDQNPPLGGMPATINGRKVINKSSFTVYQVGMEMNDGALIHNLGILYLAGGALIEQKKGPARSGIFNYGGTIQRLGGGSPATILVPVFNIGELLWGRFGILLISNLSQIDGETRIDSGSFINVTCPFEFNGGTLTGFGTLGGDVMQGGGLVKPGNESSTGILTIQLYLPSSS